MRNAGTNIVFRGSLSSRTGVVGLCLTTGIVAIAVLGPLVAPHSQSAIVSGPYQGPSASYPLGTDSIGRDALSRFLLGGRLLLGGAVAATILAYGVGTVFGLAAGYMRGRVVDFVVVGLADLIISFPALILALIVISGVGTATPVAVGVIAVIMAPQIARFVRAATVDVTSNDYVEAAMMRGEGLRYLLFREILPNIWHPLLADIGIRFAVAISILASLSYLGLGPPPPTADWGVMIGENTEGLLIQPWVVVIPAVAIILSTVGVNLAGDAVSQRLGRSRADVPI